MISDNQKNVQTGCKNTDFISGYEERKQSEELVDSEDICVIFYFDVISFLYSFLSFLHIKLSLYKYMSFLTFTFLILSSGLLRSKQAAM